MSNIRFFLFGRFRVEASARVVEKIEPRKAEELLVYLLLHRDQPQSREHLAEVLWAELSPEQSKSYLRKALWQLQSMLETLHGKEILRVDAEWIRLNPRFEFWLDIAAFSKAFHGTLGVRGKDLDDTQIAHLQSVVEMYQSGLLEGWYQDWCIYEREHLQYLQLAMLDKLMDYAEARSEYEQAMAFGKQILRCEKAHERTHRRLIRLYYLAGDRTSALRQYRRCVHILREELSVEPAESTQELYEKVRKDRLEEPNLPEKGTSMALEAVIKHLSSFHQQLNQIQGRLAEDIEKIHQAIKRQA